MPGLRSLQRRWSPRPYSQPTRNGRVARKTNSFARWEEDGAKDRREQAASTVTGRRRLRQGRVALFVPGASNVMATRPREENQMKLKLAFAMLLGAASYAWGARPNLEWQWSAHHGQDTWRRIVQMLD